MRVSTIQSLINRHLLATDVDTDTGKGKGSFLSPPTISNSREIQIFPQRESEEQVEGAQMLLEIKAEVEELMKAEATGGYSWGSGGDQEGRVGQEEGYYDESGNYYDPSSGMYWNPNTGEWFPAY